MTDRDLEPVTRDHLRAELAGVEVELGELREEVRVGFAAVDVKLAAVDVKLAGVDVKLAEQRSATAVGFAEVDARLERLGKELSDQLRAYSWKTMGALVVGLGALGGLRGLLGG
jgi:hypothetical protein